MIPRTVGISPDLGLTALAFQVWMTFRGDGIGTALRLGQLTSHGMDIQCPQAGQVNP